MSDPADGTRFIDWLWTGSALPQGAFARMGVFDDTFAGDPADEVDAIRTNWNESLNDEVHSAATVVFRLSEWQGGGLVVLADSTPLAGGAGSGDPLPPNVTYLMRKNTASGGRRNRGRMYIPAVPEANSNGGGDLTPTAATNFAADCTSFLEKMAADDLTLTLFRQNAADEFLMTAITSLVGEGRLATQRRRLR